MILELAVIPACAISAAITPLRQALPAAIAPAMLPWFADKPQAEFPAMPKAIRVFATSNLSSFAQAAAAPMEPYQV